MTFDSLIRPLGRVIEPEWLDDMSPSDPRARHSRQDLRRINFIMGNAGILSTALRRHASSPPQRLIELGAGDGTLMLRIARALASEWKGVHVVFVDQVQTVSARTKETFSRLGWTIDAVTADVFDYLAGDLAADVVLCNLFLHHFSPEPLRLLLQRCADRTGLFIACEPSRSRLPLWSSHLLSLIGCNDVTRHDAVASVKAGFHRQDLTELWPDSQRWTLLEHGAGAFSHLFVATRPHDASCL